jgi:hypothetical protein
LRTLEGESVESTATRYLTGRTHVTPRGSPRRPPGEPAADPAGRSADDARGAPPLRLPRPDPRRGVVRHGGRGPPRSSRRPAPRPGRRASARTAGRRVPRVQAIRPATSNQPEMRLFPSSSAPRKSRVRNRSVDRSLPCALFAFEERARQCAPRSRTSTRQNTAECRERQPREIPPAVRAFDVRFCSGTVWTLTGGRKRR